MPWSLCLVEGKSVTPYHVTDVFDILDRAADGGKEPHEGTQH